MYTENILAKHHFSKYNKVLLQIKRRFKVTLPTFRLLLELIFLVFFLKLDTNVHMYIQRPQNNDITLVKPKTIRK